MSGNPEENIINDVTSYLQESERPDMTSLIEYFKNGSLNPEVKLWKGFRFWPRFNPETAKFAYEDMTYKDSDVIVASFAKTGTTWIRMIVHHLVYDSDPMRMEISSKMNMPFSYLETGIPLKFQVVNKLPLPRRVFGTHLNAQLVNLNKIKKSGAKVIYCIRNPKDQAVSWYHMYQNYPFRDHPNFKHFCPKSWDEFFKLYTSGKQPLCTRDGEWYPDHVMSWYEHRDDVMFVVYEEIKQNPVKGILEIAKFLNIPATLGRAQQIADMTSFNNMAANLKKGHPIKNFFRKGEVGDWKNYFSDDQSKIMDELIQEKLGNTEIRFIYEL
uniref:Sulfotransferase n=1 Tax=Ciona intestinalis TaxID=7719 RepID=F6Y7J1_CIOIN|nr:sulfotransferase 6B1-like [Ciona intestinalis]|eukprot:XP_002120573.1 sulfotransferase 6B1-like [Ciona intestinalis]